MSVLFWGSLFLLVYPLAVYPFMLAVMRPSGKREEGGYASSIPMVSILLSVYNEKDIIERKVRNFLALDYPADCLELIVVSDGSDDGTDELARRSGSVGVRVLRQETRSGKTQALNRAVREARGEILFFTDADSMLKSDCLRRITAPFADPDVGLVSGRSVYLDREGRETAGSLYRRYEEWIKEREGDLYGIAGADGAIYAMRRELYRELPPEYINDLLHPVQVVLDGKKALCTPKALVTEPDGSDGFGNELSRQTRIMTQSWLIFLRHAPRCLPRNVMVFLAICFAQSPALVDRSLYGAAACRRRLFARRVYDLCGAGVCCSRCPGPLGTPRRGRTFGARGMAFHAAKRCRQLWALQTYAWRTVCDLEPTREVTPDILHIYGSGVLHSRRWGR